MSLHPKLVEALDQIDAAVFSGDSFIQYEGREAVILNTLFSAKIKDVNNGT